MTETAFDLMSEQYLARSLKLEERESYLTAASREALLTISKGGIMRALRKSSSAVSSLQKAGLVTSVIPIQLTALGEETLERVG